MRADRRGAAGTSIRWTCDENCNAARHALTTRSVAIAAIVAILAVLTASCGNSTNSNKRVTSMSIVSLPPGANLIGNGGFDGSGFGPWTLRLAPGIAAAIDPQVGFSGRHSIRITARAPRVATSLVLEQNVLALPNYTAESQYELRFRARTVGLSRPIQTELKLNYAGGGYSFHRGRPTGSTPTSSGTGIPSGTSAGWIKMVVKATARFRLESISAFVIDSGLGPLSGTVWIDDVELRPEGANVAT